MEDIDAKVFEFIEQLVKNRRSPNEWIAFLRNGSNFGIGKALTEDEANILLMRYLSNPNASYSPKLGNAWKANCGI